MRRLVIAILIPVLLSCSAGSPPAGMSSPEAATLARVYYWRALPGKLEEYNRYIREVAEPIDEEARRRGAFLSVTTYVNADDSAPWTHMRVFLLRDRAQFDALSQQLSAAGARLEPDSMKRRAQGEYSATLRARVGEDTLTVLH